MHEAAEALAESLLYEGYALYPYTPGATKNATPTPFGIVYPPAYAERQPAAFDHVRVECVRDRRRRCRGRGRGALPAGRGRASPGARAPGRRSARCRARRARSRRPSRRGARSSFGAERTGIVDDDRRRRARGRSRGRACGSTNTTPVSTAEAARMRPWRRAAREPALGPRDARGRPRQVRLAARARGRARRGGGGCENVNTWPVLAAPGDDAVLGAAIMLPDHPQMAPAEQGQHVRQHRDRGGAAAPRPGA